MSLHSPHIVTDVSKLIQEGHKLMPIVQNYAATIANLCTWLLVDVLVLMCMTTLAMGASQATEASAASFVAKAEEGTDELKKKNRKAVATISETGHSVSSGLYFLGFLSVLVSSFYFGKLQIGHQKDLNVLMKEFDKVKNSK